MNAGLYRLRVINHRGSAPQEHPSVSAVEQILSVAVARSAGHVLMRDGRVVVDRAVWFCACVTFEDAPVWLIYDTSGGKVDWCRVSDGDNVADLVDAPLITGSHVDPVEVLHWLQNPDAGPVPGDGSADGAVVQEIGRKIRDLQSD